MTPSLSRFIYSIHFLIIGLFFTVTLSGQISPPEILLEGYGDILENDVQDFNNDGLEDILITYVPSFENARFGIFLYTAYMDGEVLKHTTERVSEMRSYQNFLGDINGDGWMDLVVYGTNTENINGAELITYINTNGVLNKADIDLSFFNADGRSLEDIVDMNADGLGDFIFIQKGDPTFHDTLKMAINEQENFDDIHLIAPEPRQYKFGDLNNDMWLDVILEEFISGQPPKQTLYAYIAQGDFTFEGQLLDTNFASLKSIFHIEDIDGDQYKDVIIEDAKNDLLYTINNIVTDDPIRRDTFLYDFKFGYLYDYDFDDDLDLHFANSDTSLVMLNDGSGNFNSAPIYQPLPPQYPKGTYLADNNLPDRNYFGDNTLYTYYYEDNIYREEKFRNAQYHIGSLDDVEIIDINEDGYLDIVFASRWSDLVGYFPGQPNKNFGSMVPIVKDELGAKSISFADFNNDGHLDLNITGIWSHQNSIRYGDGAGNFVNKEILFDNLGFSRGEAVGDYESDGYADIVVGKYGSNSIFYRKNHEGFFEDQETITVEFSPTKLHAKDMDFDGDEDLVYRTTGMLRWLANENGTFGSEQYLANAVVSDYFFIDMDNDGKDEVISADEDRIYIYKWNGLKYEVWKSVLGNETNSYAHFVPFDYNGDGFVDLIVALNSSTHRLFQNVNNETFEYDGLVDERYDFSFNNFSTNIDYVTDVDGDGDYDWLFDHKRDLFKVSNLKGEESLQGKVYWDENLDSLHNAEELIIPNARITAFNGLDEEYFAFTDDFGNFKFFLDPNDYILFATPPNDCWESLSPEQLAVNYADGNPLNGIEFRMKNNGEDKPAFSTSFIRQRTRCGFTVRYFISLTNDGCQTFDGQASVVLDDRVPDFFDISLPEFSVLGNAINFDIENLAPGQKLRFDLLVEVPGVDFLGEEMIDFIKVYDDGSSNEVYSKAYFSEINCAYDPNDKLVSPDRSRAYGDAYILDETMMYTIRFQNTGTDTAFNIRLADTLSELLDLSTFRPVDASHDYSILLNSNERILQVFFENVLLPDSHVNYLESNGFFTFEIKPVESLPEFTPITNEASIYFDFNPPIITNEVKNIYVSDLSLITSTDAPIKNEIQIYPNPSSGNIHIETETDIMSVSVVDLNGKNIPFSQLAGHTEIEVEQNGIYFIKVHTAQASYTQKIVVISK